MNRILAGYQVWNNGCGSSTEGAIVSNLRARSRVWYFQELFRQNGVVGRRRKQTFAVLQIMGRGVPSGGPAGNSEYGSVSQREPLYATCG